MVAPAHAIPAEVEPVLAVLNSLDVEEGTDDWAAGPAALGHWLSAHHLAPAGVTVSRSHYDLALDLRRGLRAMALANNGVAADPDTVEGLDRTLRRFPLVVRPATGTLAGTNRAEALRALDAVVAGYAYALATGQWHRMRQCPAGDCAWVFWDSSARAARRWCTMGVCGNRAKARAFAARRRG